MKIGLTYMNMALIGLLLFTFFPLRAMGDVGGSPPNPTSLGAGINVVQTNIVNTDSGLAKDPSILPIVAKVINWLLALSAMLAMGALVWGGIMYILSLGDEGKAGKAKQIILYAVIGVVLVLLSFVIIKVVQTTLTTTTLGDVNTVYAASGFNEGIKNIDDNVKPGDSGLATDDKIAPIILEVVNLLLSLVAVLALAALIWGSIMYILSLGDEGKAEKAKKIILYAIIGVLLAGASYMILKVIQTLLTT